MVRKFGKFLKKSKDRKFCKSPKKIENNNNNNNNNYICFECGKQGHIKYECPIYFRKMVKRKERRTKNKRKPTSHGMIVHQQPSTLQVMKKLQTYA